MKRILLADDEESLLLAFSRVLIGPELSIDTVESASGAVRMLGMINYDALIVDLRLTGTAAMDGLRVLEYASIHQPYCCRIVMTAFSDPPIRERVLSTGDSYFIEKPVSPLVIRRILESLPDKAPHASVQPGTSLSPV